jgi:hypothetical protein
LTFYQNSIDKSRACEIFRAQVEVTLAIALEKQRKKGSANMGMPAIGL